MPFNDILQDPTNELLRDRLGRLINEIPALAISTREEYLAQIFSRVNKILAIGSGMTPLTRITPEGPALIGDLVANFNTLNQDGADIASYILRTEALSAEIYNQISATQNALRQKIRERLLSSSKSRYVEEFIKPASLNMDPNMLDTGSGMCHLPLLGEKDATASATISSGAGSVGTTQSNISNINGPIGQAFLWNGPALELDVTFAAPVIINRLQLGLDDYQGLELVSLTSTPDGIITEDILADLQARTIDLGATSGKYSGDVIIDFPPKQCSVLKILIEDRVGQALIALRSLKVLSRQYDSTGSVATTPILMTGSIVFSSSQSTWKGLTSVVHQISYDGVNYKAIAPGNVQLLSSPFWYKGTLSRVSGAFTNAQAAVAAIGSDPLQNPDYILSTSSSLPLGHGITERTLVFQQISGPILLREAILAGTLQVQQGSVTLTGSQYTFAGGILSFPAPMAGITVSYQTASSTPATLAAKEKYYTPLLSRVAFEVND